MDPATVIEALEPYVPRWVRRRLEADPSCPERPSIERFEACVLLADMSGFTSFAERARGREARGAEEVQEVLNSCFGRLGDLIERHGGEVLAFAGDAALGLWQSDGAGGLRDAALRAARCGIAIRDEVDGVEAPGGFQIRLRIAVTSGPAWRAIVGGVDARWEAFVGGFPLEALARTLERARPGELVLSEEAAALLNVPAKASQDLGLSQLEVLEESGRSNPPRLGPPAERGLRAFVPATVQARIDAGQTEWLAEFRHVTVMFVGLRDLGDGAGRIDPIHEITCAMQAAVHSRGGQVTQMLVDEKGMMLLAAWGVAHHAYEDNAARGVAAGLAIAEAFRELDIPGAIGLASGRVWTGRRGYAGRSEFAMIGDVVNLAARLMQASETTALCDEATMREASSVREFERMGTIPIKGKREPAPIYRPLEEKRSPRHHGVPELIGRVAEQKLLFGAVEGVARHGRRGAYLVSGDAGVGKSHLISKVLDRAEDLGVGSDCVWGHAVPSTGAYADVRELLRSRAGLQGVVDPAEQLERVRGLLGLPGHEPTLALLGSALGFELPENEVTSAMSAQARAEATRELLVTLYAKATGGGPTLLVLEDAHWLDSPVWAWVAALRDRIDALLLVIATRPMGDALPEDARQVLEQPDVERVDLDGLDPVETEALVCQRLGVETVPPIVARLVHERSEGHPFFAEELAYSLRDRGLVELRRRECVLVGQDLEGLEFPDTVEDVVTSRIDLLGASEQLTLKVASVLGRIFDLADLAAIHPIPTEPADLEVQLDSMARLELVVREGERAKFAFKHAITRQVAYGLLAFAQRRRLHLAAAQRYEEAGDALRPAYALLAHHWRHADRVERAQDYLEKAGDRAAEDFANAEAAGFFEEALVLEAGDGDAGVARFRLGALSPADVRRASWLRKLGETRSSLGQIDRAVPSLVQALEALGRRPPRTERGWAARTVLEVAGRLVRRVIPPALRLRARRSEEAILEEVRTLSLLGANYYVLDRILPFVGALFSAAGAADAIGPTRDRALAYADMGNVAGIVPLNRLARRYGRIALATAEAVNEPRTTARIVTRTAIYLGSAGTWRVKELDEALAIADRLGDDHIWEEAGTVLSGHLYFLGDLKRCYAVGSEVAERAARSGSLLHELWGLTTQAQCLLHFGRYEEAVERCRDTIVHLDADGGPDRDSAIKAHGILAGAQHRLGRTGPAFAAADLAADLIERFGRVGYQFFPGAGAVADLYLSAWEENRPVPGDDVTARAGRLCKHLESFSRRYRVAVPRTLVFRGRAEWMRGRRTRAERAFTRGLVQAEALGMGFEAALARFERARRLEPGAARSAEVRAAAEVFEAAGAVDELQRVELVMRDAEEAAG